MKMPKYELFLGLPIKGELAEALGVADEAVKKIFIKDEEKKYLEQIHSNGTDYLGKFVGAKCDLQKLHGVENNINSLLARIVPNYSCPESPLKLFPAEVID